jgi:hypothetical protein
MIGIRVPLPAPFKAFMNKYYIVYITSNKVSWIILETIHDLNHSAGIMAVIEQAKQQLETEIVPVFWKKLID